MRIELIKELIKQYEETKDTIILSEILGQLVMAITSKVILIPDCESCLYEDNNTCKAFKREIEREEGKNTPDFCKLPKFDEYLMLIEDVQKLQQPLLEQK